MAFDFLLITSTNTGPCHAFYTPDQFFAVLKMSSIFQNLATETF